MNIEKIEFGGYRIGIPVPFPMKYVYCYLFKQNNGYVLIDVGLNYPAAREMWQEIFDHFEIGPQDIRTIYLTHFHPDHSGLSGWMQEHSGADLFMNEVDARMIELEWGEGNVYVARMKEMVLQHGVPVDLADEITDQMDNLQKNVLPLPASKPIGDKIEFGEKQWSVIHTPGHSPGHICFFQEEEGILIGGDHVLEKITPNISVMPGACQQPLHEYIDSLRKLKKYPIKKIYPAHHTPVLNVNERIDELIQHHEERLAYIESLADHNTTYEIAKILFSYKELNSHQWRFAIAETIAHLNYLEREGRITKQNQDPIVYIKKYKIGSKNT
ncbi:MBL fold metallo-hydrolase [Bacillus sp. REN16]|uniref:MBL fold metallo-hydrolase n=1 Tax=Bacillus sp. REN16 TaxID=2887296 RepID=UPI001E2ED8DF|nr:MBL fold metallo-hydrolase [Bacillus sp. REN16]MCC3357953.1 MBL fold metallo-hydrolase [Bacillus sp. REN16]